MAADLARRLLGPGGRFGTLQGILGGSNPELFRALAEVAPGEASATIRRVLLPLADNELQGIAERQGRQTLVFALEKMAFHSEHFIDAARALFALARIENAASGGLGIAAICSGGGQGDAVLVEVR